MRKTKQEIEVENLIKRMKEGVITFYQTNFGKSLIENRGTLNLDYIPEESRERIKRAAERIDKPITLKGNIIGTLMSFGGHCLVYYDYDADDWLMIHKKNITTNKP